MRWVRDEAVTTWRDCSLWKPCDPVVPDIVVAQGDLLIVAVIVLVVGGLFVLAGLGRAE